MMNEKQRQKNYHLKIEEQGQQQHLGRPKCEGKTGNA